MENILNKVVKILRETGEHVIFLDSQGESALVIMSLEEYQKSKKGSGLVKDDLGNLTEEQFLNKINREIADWKSAQPSPAAEIPVADMASPSGKSSLKITTDSANSSPTVPVGEKGERFYFEPVDDGR